MSKIAYDPVKDKFAGVIKNARFFRTVFYRLLDLFFLRGWYVRGLLKQIYHKEFHKRKEWNLLDAGCGFGQYDRFILSHFPNVKIRSVDVKEDYLNDCRRYFRGKIKKGRIDFGEADLLDIELEPSYDAVICVDVLEHIEEDVRVMTNLCRGLKPGGYFIMHSPSHFAEEDAEGDEFFVGEHARAGYSKEDLAAKLKKAGMEPVNISYSYGKYGHAAWVMLIKNPMLWLTRWGMGAMVILPFYYLITVIPGLILMRMDMSGNNEKGTGIYALAMRPKSSP